MEESSLKQKHDIHWRRKLWHMVGVVLMVVVYNIFGAKVSWVILGFVAIVIVPMDVLRRNDPKLNKFVCKVLGPVMRRHEYKSLSGMTYLIIGTILLLGFFPHHILNLSLLFLAFADPIASYFGIRFGKDKIVGNKTLQGSLAAFAVCTTVAALYYYFNNIMLERLFIVAPVSGLIGAIAELVPVGKLDDNFTFPVVSALCLWVLFQLFGGFGL